jgi:hypothetical protein
LEAIQEVMARLEWEAAHAVASHVEAQAQLLGEFSMFILLEMSCVDERLL